MIGDISKENRECFVNYAHRGASEYMPENTLLSFYNGIAMGANIMTVNFPDKLTEYINICTEQ